MYKTISFTLFLAFMYIGVQILSTTNIEHSWLPNLVIVLVTFPLMLMFLNVGAGIDNCLLKKKLGNRTKIWVTHRGTQQSIQDKINNNLLPAHGVYASSCLQKLLGNRLLKLIDHDKPVVWVHIGMPKDVSDRKLGLTKKHNYTNAISFEIPPQDLEFPKGIIKKLYGKHQCVIENDVIIPTQHIVSRKNKHDQWV